MSYDFGNIGDSLGISKGGSGINELFDGKVRDMNRLVIIGNGFDLAHGLKTSFYDFLEDYLSHCIKEFLKHDHFEDCLHKTKPIGRTIVFVKNSIQEAEDAFAGYKILEDEGCISNQSVFLSNIITLGRNIRWVDIELEYFKRLKAVRETKSKEELLKTNNEFAYLKEKLITYLEKETSINVELELDIITDSWKETIKSKEAVLRKLDGGIDPDLTYFLNFNYTNTALKYIQEFQRSGYKCEMNHIHGDLKEIFDEPIFGYGDDLDEDFIAFEKDQDNELYKHMKSFQYARRSNYFELIRFIDSEPFQVCIYGHSCGLSDRTMLNEIFENENCISIKIFYYQRPDGTSDFMDKVMDISRHFTNKGLMRKKIVPFEISRPFPNLKNTI